MTLLASVAAAAAERTRDTRRRRHDLCELSEVSYPEKTAVVTFDDARTTVAALTQATAGVGFPSRVAE
jgi:mercuric ion binding protein